jgi:hypothetical protein
METQKNKLKILYSTITDLYQVYNAMINPADQTESPPISSFLLLSKKNINKNSRVKSSKLFNTQNPTHKSDIPGKDSSNKSNIHNQINKLKYEEAKIRDEMIEIKDAIDQIKNELYELYSQFIEKGKNPELEGLHHPIKCIWQLGKKVNYNRFPKFLDILSIQFSVSYATKDAELFKLLNNKKIVNLEHREKRLRKKSDKEIESVGSVYIYTDRN